MDCLACRKPMVSDLASDYAIQSCRSCGAAWLDSTAVEKHLSAPPGSALEHFRKLVSESSDASVRDCPACSIPLRAFHYRGVELDLCSRCHGLFLDPTEMRKVGLVTNAPGGTNALALVLADPFSLLLLLFGGGSC